MTGEMGSMTGTPADRPTKLGAAIGEGGVHFSVWAPNAAHVTVAYTRADGSWTETEPLQRSDDGLHSGFVANAGAGTLYRFKLDGGEGLPDPWSRFQPEGPHGPSEVIDPATYEWNDGAWPGLTSDGLVIYECHVGTYTPEGTYAALMEQLPELKSLGISALEIMPVAQCPGRWNWGYDGVDLFAPSNYYGRPDDLKRLVDAAHANGLGVLLDVVYNHLGPDGNYLRAFADDYFTDRHMTPWGEAINYDGRHSAHVRNFVIANACYWLSEFHFDGLRLDATDAILDDSSTPILEELTAAARASVAPRQVVVIAEDARNDVRIIRPRDRGGYGLDGVWADDFHHEMRVFLTGTRGNYLDSYTGATTDMARTLNRGFLFEGQVAKATGEPRGTQVTDEPATSFVFNIQNHDQVGNRAYGERLHHEIDLGRFHVATALLLFSPYTPLIFMGQEFAASSSFMYFTDHNEELGKLVTEGRREEFKGFPAFADPERRRGIPDPQSPETFLRSKLNLAERELHAGTYALYRELLRLRREDPVLTVQEKSLSKATAVGPQIVIVERWHENERRLLVANFGPSVGLTFADQPDLSHLLAADLGLLITSSDRKFGGDGSTCGLVTVNGQRRIEMPARTATIFAFSE
jgi:maltooligosyltrehalose trehalohydrolase